MLIISFKSINERGSLQMTGIEGGDTWKLYTICSGSRRHAERAYQVHCCYLRWPAAALGRCLRDTSCGIVDTRTLSSQDLQIEPLPVKKVL
jgi:hypothetical protein